MSGGALDYFSCADVIDKLTDVYIAGKNEHSKETLEIIKQTIDVLHKADIYAHRVEWYLSGDDGEESLKKRLEEDLKEYEASNKEIPCIEPKCKYCIYFNDLGKCTSVYNKKNKTDENDVCYEFKLDYDVKYKLMNGESLN